ncbi:hypothetical protein TSOC_003605, partial [Tetrabaena socialis]
MRQVHSTATPGDGSSGTAQASSTPRCSAAQSSGPAAVASNVAAGGAVGAAAACCEATEESAALPSGPGGAACDPWVAARRPWSGAHGLPRDIEDLHAAACSAGKKTYDDPPTGYSVFTEVGLAPRGCCANRCRHCPWGHFKVQGRPRLNRLSRPALLQLNARARRPKPSQQQLQSPPPQQQQQQQQQPKDAPGRWRWLTGPAGAGGGAAPSVNDSSGSGGGADGAGGAGGVTLVCYEGCAASEALARELASKQQPVVLLAAFDVDSGALWGAGAGAAAVYPAAPDSAGGPGQPSGIGSAMDAALRLDLDLVAVPLQAR